jgi:hypothetical protein
MCVFYWEQNHLDKAKPRVIGGRKATGLEQRQPGCLDKGNPAFLFGPQYHLLELRGWQNRQDLQDLIHDSKCNPNSMNN